ncbi:SRPBCC domain-containing protein [Microbacterium deminutum]|uniref:SRPBCC domain-containing protein n=1 Tax=Microbacterium deminutum TaxID=344164 RepID=A0ABP5CBI8_9MICO
MVDVNAQIDAVTRGVQTMDVDGEPARVQTVAQTFPAPIDDVWDAITSAERIPRWFLPISGELRLGGHYQLEGNAGGEVQECAPPTGGAAHYRITWAYGGGADTWVTVRLEAVSAEATLLELEHIAKVADVPDAMWAQFGPSGTGIGWDSGFLGLALHLGGAGDGPTPEEGMAWMMSDEGRRFARGAADGWAAAHVEDGADADTAARAAEATYHMYTGQSVEGMPDA